MRCRTYVVLVVLLLIISGAGCNGIGGGARPRAKLAGVHFGELNHAALELVFDVKIKNPYSAGMPLTSMSYRLSSKRIELAVGSAKPNTTIEAGAKEKVSLPVRVHYGEILRTLKDVEPGSRIPYNVALVLSVDAGGAGELEVPLRKKGKITLPFVSGVTYKRILELVE